MAETLRDAGDVVIVWGERIAQGERGPAAIDALLAVAAALGIEDKPESGLIEVPESANARGLREAGVLPNLGPGLADAPAAGRAAAEIADGLIGGELSTLVLLHADPLVTHPGRARWEDALEAASSVIAFAEFATEALPSTPAWCSPPSPGPEGGHPDPPRRSPAARAPGDRPPGPDTARVERAGRARRPLRRLA